MSKTSFAGLTPSGGSRVDFAAIKGAVDLVAVIESRGVELKREGKDWVGLCPFHADTRPSLRVTPGNGLWRCMSPTCRAAGNAIQFVAKKDGVGDKEAAVRLLSTLPGVQTAARLEKKVPGVVLPPNVAAELLSRVVGFYHRTLFKADRAGLEYLASRNLADAAMLEAFQVGYCNGTLKSALPSSGEILSQLQSLGVLNAKGNEVFYGRVIVPIRDEAGVVVGLYGRKVEGPGAKLGAEATPHLYLAGGHQAAFNAAAAKHASRVIFVESILDAVSVWQAGERAVVPLYGAEGFTGHHEKLVRETEAREVLLALDNDEAGRAGTQRLQMRLPELLAGRMPPAAVRVLAWPEGMKDANAFFSDPSRSAADFAALIAAAEPRPQTDPVTAGKEETIEPRENGFALVWPQRRYEVMAVERQGGTRLRATVKALGAEPGRFHVETLDLYSARARRLFAAEVARAFRVPSGVIESDLGKLLLGAEQRAANAAGSAGKPAAAIVSEPDKAEGLKLGRSADLVGDITGDLKRLGIVGEAANGLLMYLTMTSRKMADPLAVHVVSGSGAGKSHLQDAVLTLCPDEDLIKLTSLSSQALFYKGEDSLRHKCLAVEEVAGASGARYAVRNLISAKKLAIETTIKNPLTGKMETQVNTVYGPTAVFETTTDPKTDPETKSRFIVSSIDESPEQTRAILEAQRHRHTLDGLRTRHARGEVLRRHHAFQRLLRPILVANNYEPLLGYGDDRLVFRRDNPKYLHLILAVTFLHQMQRPVRHDEVIGQDYIETTLDDVAIANELAVELFGMSLDDLSRPGRELLERMTGYVRGKAARSKTPSEKVEFCRRELREALGWGEYQLRTHLGELVELEYVVPLGGRFGSVFTYRLCYDGDSGRRFVPGLKSVEQLRREAGQIGLTSCGFSEPRGPEMPPRALKTNLVGTSLNGKREVVEQPSRETAIAYANGRQTSGLFDAAHTATVNGSAA